MRNTLLRLGLDVRRARPTSGDTLLGLRARPIRTVLDVGANIGQFAKQVRAVFPDARLYSFEPLPSAYAQLETWASSQPGDRVRTFKLAIGDAVGTVEMHHHTDFSPSSSILESISQLGNQFPQTRKQAIEQVPLTTLDAMLADLSEPLDDEILLKIDTQGYEEYVFRGAPETLNRVAACIVEVNLDALYNGQPDFTTVHSAMSQHGLEYRGNLDQACADDGHVMFLDAVFVRP